MAGLFSSNITLVSVDKLVSVELSNKKQRQNFEALQLAQKFFCDYLPVASNFVFQQNLIRRQLMSLHSTSIKEENKFTVEACDENFVKAYREGIGFVSNWAKEYFQSDHHFSPKRDSVTVTVRSFLKSDESDLALSIKSDGPRQVEKTIKVSDDASLVDFKYQADHETEKKVGAFVCNDLIEWTINKKFFHPSLNHPEHTSYELLQNSYHSLKNKFFRIMGKKSLSGQLLNQWKACWLDPNNHISSMCVFPVTLANNTVPDDFMRAISGESAEINKDEVFGILSLESPDPYAFTIADVLMGRIWADALFTFAGAMSHYSETSMLRKNLGNFDLNLDS